MLNPWMEVECVPLEYEFRSQSNAKNLITSATPEFSFVIPSEALITTSIPVVNSAITFFFSFHSILSLQT